MRALIQRVISAHVMVNEKKVGSCEKGFLIYLGIHITDQPSNSERLAKKITGLRVFEDENQKMNYSLKEVSQQPQALVISNFTLYGQVEKGYRPNFMESANFDQAKELYNHFIESLKSHDVQVAAGAFGENMKVHSIVDGPFNLILNV